MSIDKINTNNKISQPRVALVHDHLAQDGGAEKVLKVLSDLYPEAPIYTLLYEKKHADKYLKGREIKTSIIQRLPGGVRFYQWYMPFMPTAVEFYDLSEFDIVISDASAFAKGVITSPDTLHICYCHTPTRYLWDYTHQYINELRFNKYFKKIISLVLNKIRIWDFVAAQRVDLFIANSMTVQRRIKKYYRRDSVVIYPPVETGKFGGQVRDSHLPAGRYGATLQDDSGENTVRDCQVVDAPRHDKKDDSGGKYFLIGGRLAPYKRVDIVVEAFKNMPDKGLKVFGSGVDLERLQGIADKSDNIEFLGRVTDEEKIKLYRGAEAFLNPQEEDFGITVIEAMAAGIPVIAYKKGGATETVIEGRSGLFFEKQESEDVVEAVKKFDSIVFDKNYIKGRAEEYSEEKFVQKIKNFIEEKYSSFKE